MIIYANENNKPKAIVINESKLRLLRENSITLPKIFVHSANPNGQREINALLSSFPNLNEDVFISNLNKNKANLSYNKRNSTSRMRNLGNLNSFDMLDTSKMDQNDNDTFIVPLKGGINSYNITSIKGTEVMHYFKNKFQKKKTEIEMSVNGKKSMYELMMEDSEFQEFLNVFITKVSNVVSYCINEFKQTNKDLNINGISIYPVPSSSNFNIEMCKVINERIKIANLPTRTVNEIIFKKDLTNLQKDTDFINKNKEYYNSTYFKGNENGMTHIDALDDTVRKYGNTTAAQDKALVDEYNKWIRRTIQSYRTKSSPKTIAKNYINVVNAMKAIRTKLSKARWDKAFKQIKYAKGPSIENRTIEIQNIVSSVLGKTFIIQNPIEMVEIEPQNFQIKNLTNDIRMGLKNYFQPQNGIEEELQKIKGTVFVIFDDNISGGATLSDICYQAKQLGIEYIIPITFGEMRTKYSQGLKTVNKPIKWNF
jgi:hypothetical protein